MLIDLVKDRKDELIKNISPNFTRNRYDILFKRNYELIKLVDSNREIFIPIYIQKGTLFIGIYLSELDNSTFNYVIKYLFKKYRLITRIKLFSSVNSYNQNHNLTCHIDYITELPETEQDYLNSLSSQTRYNLKRKAKKITSDLGGYKVNIYNAENIPNTLMLKYFSFKRVTHKKIYSITPQEYIYEYHVTKAYEMVINKMTVAILLISELDGSVYLENLTYDTSLKKYSLGILLSYFMINDSRINKKTLIYWGCDDSYKKHFSNIAIRTYSGYIYRSRFWMFVAENFKNIIRTKRTQYNKIISICGLDIVLPKCIYGRQRV